MRILFIDPPFQRFMNFYRYYYPIGLAYMAAILDSKNHHVEIYDSEHSPETETTNWLQAAETYTEYVDGLQNDDHPIWREIRNKIEDFAPDVIGITMLSVKVRSAYKIAKLSKEINPNITIIVGADHPTIFPNEVLQTHDIDFVVRGEGENTILELISHIEDPNNHPLESIKGISYRLHKKIIHNPNRGLISNLDELPFPGIKFLSNLSTYRPSDFGAVLASRGCPFECSFCGVSSIWTRQIRYRSIKNVIAEIEWLKSNFGTEYISFRDALFTLERGRVIMLCDDLLRKKIKIQWECLTRADLLDEELLINMKRAGCTTIRIGVESGSEEILKSMDKTLDLDSVRYIAKLLKKYNFYWAAYFLFGTPLETRETMLQTLRFIDEIDPPFTTVARYAPIPGTKMYQELVNAGLINATIDWSYESNQRLDSNYVYSMSLSEFGNMMRSAATSIYRRNCLNDEKYGVKDQRLK